MRADQSLGCWLRRAACVREKSRPSTSTGHPLTTAATRDRDPAAWSNMRELIPRGNATTTIWLRRDFNEYFYCPADAAGNAYHVRRRPAPTSSPRAEGGFCDTRAQKCRITVSGNRVRGSTSVHRGARADGEILTSPWRCGQRGRAVRPDDVRVDPPKHDGGRPGRITVTTTCGRRMQRERRSVTSFSLAMLGEGLPSPAEPGRQGTFHPPCGHVSGHCQADAVT